MTRSLASLLLSGLLVTTLLWGGCISCEQFFMFGKAANSCCGPDGHCKTRTTPAKSDLSKECKQIAIEHSQSLDHAAVPALIQQDLVIPALVANPVDRTSVVDFVDPSPPDLPTLNSTFII